MYVISKKFSSNPMKIVIVDKDCHVNFDTYIVCLRNMQIKETDDVVYFNSKCRGDYSTGNRSEFSLYQYKNIRRWKDQTFPMSIDGVVKILESYLDEDYGEYVDFQLSKLNQEITELLICISIDENSKPKDVLSLNLSLWKNNHKEDPKKESYSDCQITKDNNSWNQFAELLHSYDINIFCANVNAAVLGVIRRLKNHFVLEQYFKSYKNINELVNDY